MPFLLNAHEFIYRRKYDFYFSILFFTESVLFYSFGIILTDSLYL